MPISNKEAVELILQIDKGRKASDEERRDLEEASTLDLSKVGVASLRCLDGLKKLQTLVLSGAQVGSWDGLNELTALKVLDLRGAQIDSSADFRGLKNLEELYLINTKIDSLDGLRDLTNLKILDLSGTRVVSLKGLEKLSALRKLLLRGVKINDLTSLGGLKNLENLDLSGTQVASLKELGKLINLTTLCLRGTFVYSLDDLCNLKKLQYLDLRRTPVNSLRGLEGLNNLERLFLRGTNVASLEYLQNLNALKELDLSYTQVSSLESLSRLENLRQLYLNGAPIRSIEPLVGLTNLQELNLRETDVESFEPLNRLVDLETLDLSGTSVRSLECARNLDKLQFLCLNETPIDSLEPLANLKGLQTLWLASTQVVSLASLRGLGNLRELYLSDAKVCSLEEIRGLTKLQTLDLRGTQVRSLDALAPLDKLNNLYISRTRLDKIPQFFFDRKLPFKVDEDWGIAPGVYMRDVQLYEQPVNLFSKSRELIEAYYDERQISVNEAKVIFLGDGGVGKTHTIYRIENQGKEYCDASATPGVSITQFQRGDGSTINFWDFGGQEIMHSMHRCFLTERTCYVVVVSNRWSDVTRQARRWLKNIESFAPRSKVILAVNRWENVKVWDLDEKRLLKEFESRLVKIVDYTAKGDLTELTDAIENVVDDLHSVKMKLPGSWASVMVELRETARGAKYYITRGEYEAICWKAGVENDIALWLLDWFNDLGVCFRYFKNDDGNPQQLDYMLLNPEWLTNAVYIIVNCGGYYAENGRIKHDVILDILNNSDNGVIKSLKYKESERDFVLDVMRSFQLSFEIPKEGVEFVPALCRNETPDYLRPKQGQYKTRVRCELRYDYLPDTVVHRLMVVWSRKCQFDECKRCNCDKSWLRGLCIDEREFCGLFAMCDMGGGDDVLYIDVYQVDDAKLPVSCAVPQQLLRLLLNRIEAINVGLNLKSTTWICSNDERKASFQLTTLLKALNQGREEIQFTADGDFNEYSIRELLGQVFEDPVEIGYLRRDFSKLSEAEDKDKIEKFVERNPFLTPILDKIV